MNTEPVAVGNFVTALFAIFGTVFAKYGITASDAQQLMGIIGTLVSCLAIIISWLKQRSKVTPLANPQDNNGTPLIPYVSP